MSKELSLVFEDGIALQTGPDLAQLFIDGDVVSLGLDDLGKMSEWLAVAWENLTGAPYEHQEVGVPVDDHEFAEMVAHTIEMSSDPGPGTEPYGRKQVLERDCE